MQIIYKLLLFTINANQSESDYSQLDSGPNCLETDYVQQSNLCIRFAIDSGCVNHYYLQSEINAITG